MAGKGGLNLTHSEALEQFLNRYGKQRARLEPYLRRFGPGELRQWALDLGFETYVGTSGRVFPSVMKAGPILHAWMRRLRSAGVEFHFGQRWKGWNQAGEFLFQSSTGENSLKPAAVILALGGASWPQLGAKADWIPWLVERGIRVNPFKPANCGFNVRWSAYFQDHYAGMALKSVVLSFQTSSGIHFKQKGEMVASSYGIEGSLVYAASAHLRDEIDASGSVEVTLDLAPDWEVERLDARLAKARGSRSLASHLEHAIGFRGIKAGLLREVLPREAFDHPAQLAAAIKRLPITLTSARPLAEAISSAGGLAWEDLDRRLMIGALPGVFAAGEMLDWEAPTGGYLLTACCSTGRAAAHGALEWLAEKSETS